MEGKEHLISHIDYFSLSYISIAFTYMKPTLIALLILLCSLPGRSFAQNHVPNASFEVYNSCPTGFSQISSCFGWGTFTMASPDYYHACGSGNAHVPDNVLGYQAAASGGAYAGIIAYQNAAVYREYLTTQITPLQIGRMYRVAMSVSRADQSAYGSNNLGIHFFIRETFPMLTSSFLTKDVQVPYARYGILKDSSGWTRLTGYFTADSAYTGIVIGGFRANSDVQATVVAGNVSSSAIAYYYIDSVEVTPAPTGIWIMHADTTVCVNDTLDVDYVANGITTGNKFILQLSNASGSFANPIRLDSANANTSSTFKARFPANLPAGSGYRIRIVSTLPAITSEDNGFDITILPKPAKPQATTNAPLCDGDLLRLNIGNTMSGASYGWVGPGGFSAALPQAQRPGVTPAASGNYVVTVTAGGCSDKDTVAVNVYPIPAAPNAGTINPACIGGDITLTASNIPGATYTWGGPVAYYAAVQNPVRTNAKATYAGNYWVTATVDGCTSPADTINVTMIQGPEVSIYPNPSDTICDGWDVSFVALPKNAGGTPTYQWYKNGIFTGGTGASYKASGVTDGDTFYVKMTAGTVCNTPITSQPIIMKVLPAQTPPTISITATPGTHVWPYVAVTFKATTGNADTKPGYQWRRNGADIPNGKDSILQMTNLKSRDTISCVVTSNILCATPREVKSNRLIMNVDLSIDNPSDAIVLSVYPNPNSGHFILTATTAGVLSVTDLQGQAIATYEIKPGQNAIQMPQGIAAGIYIGRLKADPGVETFRIYYSGK